MNYDDLMELLCRELDDVTKEMKSRGATAGDLDAVRDITSSIKNIYKIEMFSDIDGYSQSWDDDYRRGNSYANRGTHYVRGHYSRDSARSRMISQLDSLMQEADNDGARDAIRRCKERLKQV